MPQKNKLQKGRRKMRGLGKAKVIISLAIIFSLVLSGAAYAQEKKATAEEKKTSAAREVVGVVSAVDVPYKALLVEVPRAKKETTLKVGVTLDDSTQIAVGGKKAALGDIKIGDRVRLSYIRTEKQLIAKRISVLGAGKK